MSFYTLSLERKQKRLFPNFRRASCCHLQGNVRGPTSLIVWPRGATRDVFLSMFSYFCASAPFFFSAYFVVIHCITIMQLWLFSLFIVFLSLHLFLWLFSLLIWFSIYLFICFCIGLLLCLCSVLICFSAYVCSVLLWCSVYWHASLLNSIFCIDMPLCLGSALIWFSVCTDMLLCLCFVLICLSV